MRAFTFTAIIAAVLALAAPALAQQSADQGFVIEAAGDNRAEVDLGQIAVQRAARDSVRQFGQRMVTDHGQAITELQQLAQQKGIALPGGPEDKHRAVKDRLATLAGPEFDRAYMQEMLVDHQNDVDTFEREAQSGADPEVKAWAAKTLPTLREHLRLAREIHTQVVLAPGTAQPAASVTTVVSAPVWCGGAYLPNAGTNFSTCPTPK